MSLASGEEKQTQKQFSGPEEAKDKVKVKRGACAPSTSRPPWWPACDVFMVEDLGRFSHLSFPFCHAVVLSPPCVRSWAQVFHHELNKSSACGQDADFAITMNSFCVLPKCNISNIC